MDAGVETIKNEWVDAVTSALGDKLATLETPLYTHDENGRRLVRVQETNLGDFVADAYYYYIDQIEKLDCDVAIINGGGLRAEIEAGDLSALSLKATNPFGNILCLVSLRGSQILDALEWGSRFTKNIAGEFESGSFLHTSGLTYKIKTTVESTVQGDENETFVAPPTGEYRVYDVKIYDKTVGAYVPLDMNRNYMVVGTNYTLRNKGDGFTMLEGALVKDYIVEDYMALVAYAEAFRDDDGDGFADIASANSPLSVYDGFLIDYETRYGAGRIVMN